MNVSKVLRWLLLMVVIAIMAISFLFTGYMFLNGFGGDMDFDTIDSMLKTFLMIMFGLILALVAISVLRVFVSMRESVASSANNRKYAVDRTRAGYCRSCGSNLGRGDPQYCPECGSRLRDGPI